MKLPENAWDKPEGVSVETYNRYKSCYNSALLEQTRIGNTFGVLMDDITVIGLRQKALKKLKEQGAQETDQSTFEDDLIMLGGQISNNIKTFRPKAASKTSNKKGIKTKNPTASSKKDDKKPTQSISDADFKALLAALKKNHVLNQEDTNEKTGPRL